MATNGQKKEIKAFISANLDLFSINILEKVQKSVRYFLLLCKIQYLVVQFV